MSTLGKELFYDWSGGNVWLFKKINAFSGGGGLYDEAMKLISNLTDGKHVFPYYLAGLIAIAIFSTFAGAARKRPGNSLIRNHWIAVILLFAVTFPVNAAINHYLKDSFAYPRPYVALEAPQVHQLEQRDADDAHRSFPSGHLAFIACLVLCLWSKLSESQRLLGGLAIVATGWSRIALGMHFPADIIGSFFITFGVVTVMGLVVFFLLGNLVRLKW